MTKRDRDLIRDVEALGYEFDHANSKGVRFWTHPDTGCQVKIPAGLDERVCRRVLDEARHQIGLPTKDNKRRPDLIRQRQDAERELERARAVLRHPAGRATPVAVLAAEEALRRAERRFAWWDRLMREAAAAV